MNPPPIVWLAGAAALGSAAYLLTRPGGVVSPAPSPGGQPGRYFTWAELTRSGAAAELGLANVPTPDAYRRLGLLVARVLDPLRSSLGRPVSVTSGYRSVAVNQAIGGAGESQHMTGEAADIKVAGLTAVELARRVNDLGLPFDQLIWYAPERGGHVHVSHAADRAPRREVRHAPASGGYPSYTFGGSNV